MIYEEINKDLFTCLDSYFIAHCISSDYKLGAGIALDIENKFHIKEILLSRYQSQYGVFPNCLIVGRIINLVTKDKYFHKPTYKTLEESLYKMKILCNHFGITDIAMPKIGCRLDKLNWNRVRKLIHKVFSDTNMNIKVYYI
jgi:O-acetyl-ADP-ribose deacetylase (regulator of RNase III)